MLPLKIYAEVVSTNYWDDGLLSLLIVQGYLVGNPLTGENIDTSSQVPYAHGVGIISDQLYEVRNL